MSYEQSAVEPSPTVDWDPCDSMVTQACPADAEEMEAIKAQASQSTCKNAHLVLKRIMDWVKSSPNGDIQKARARWSGCFISRRSDQVCWIYTERLHTITRFPRSSFSRYCNRLGFFYTKNQALNHVTLQRFLDAAYPDRRYQGNWYRYDVWMPTEEQIQRANEIMEHLGNEDNNQAAVVHTEAPIMTSQDPNQVARTMSADARRHILRQRAMYVLNRVEQIKKAQEPPDDIDRFDKVAWRIEHTSEQEALDLYSVIALIQISEDPNEKMQALYDYAFADVKNEVIIYRKLWAGIINFSTMYKVWWFNIDRMSEITGLDAHEIKAFWNNMSIRKSRMSQKTMATIHLHEFTLGFNLGTEGWVPYKDMAAWGHSH